MLQYSSVVLVARPEFIQTYIQLRYLAVLLEDSGPELFHRQPSLRAGGYHQERGLHWIQGDTAEFMFISLE